jgi:hypothetical protein
VHHLPIEGKGKGANAHLNLKIAHAATPKTMNAGRLRPLAGLMQFDLMNRVVPA